MLEGFSFSSPSVSDQLTGKLSNLKCYNALRMPVISTKRLTRLCEKYLNVALNSVLHPTSASARQISTVQQTAAGFAQKIRENELTAMEGLEQGNIETDPEQKLNCSSRAIRLGGGWAAFCRRGNIYKDKGDLESALRDYDDAINLDPTIVGSFSNRAFLR